MYLTDHQESLLNNCMDVRREELSQNGVGRMYSITHRDSHDETLTPMITLRFQDGEIRDGINGITDECLIAIVLDRLRGFNEGQFRCRENSLAITHFEEGLMWLKSRSKRRFSDGTEGTHQGS